MSFFAELKRRNVYRAAVLYAASAWLLVQVVTAVVPYFHIPEWVVRWIIVASVIGLPFWLAFAWFYEFTPEGLKRESEIEPHESIAHHTGRKLDFLIIGVLALAVVLLLTDRFVLRKGVNQTLAAVPEHSIAVMPFENRSEDKGQGYLADGIAEDMLNLLARVPELKVISRSSSFSFKGKDVPLKEIARTLGVAYILEGAVQRGGETLRISARLIDARSDQSVWSQAFDRPFDDVLAIQDEIAGAVVAQLKLQLFGKTREIDPDVYALYLEARQLTRTGTREGYDQALPMLQKVVAQAPDYAPAWERIGGIHLNLMGLGLMSPTEGVPLARKAFGRALEIDRDFAAAETGLAWLDGVLGDDLQSAARRFERALALGPNDAAALANAASFADNLGRSELGIALNNAAVAVDPLSSTVRYNLGIQYYNLRRTEESIANYRAALRLSPGRMGVSSLMATALVQKGANEEALSAAQQEPDELSRLIALPTVYHALGRSKESDAALAELIQKGEEDVSCSIAAVLADRGEVDRAFEWLDKAQAYDDPAVGTLHIDVMYEKLHADPRWLPLLRKLGQAPEQLATIKFDVNLPGIEGAGGGAAGADARATNPESEAVDKP